jgi:hypothetical protein
MPQVNSFRSVTNPGSDVHLLLHGLSNYTGRIFTTNREGEGVVYDSEGVELARYQMGGPIRFAQFRESANVLTILTADQRVSTMRVNSMDSAVK